MGKSRCAFIACRKLIDINDRATLFVSNLPYTATSTDLQTLFSDLAPVRSAFVVTAPGSGVSKGVGYVSFAIREDAEGAYEKVEREGLELDGRKLRVQWANKKASRPIYVD
jgi:nucleolar protein 4